MKIRKTIILGASVLGSIQLSAHAAVLFSSDFNAATVGSNADTVAGVTQDAADGYSFTISNTTAITGNSLKIERVAGFPNAEPSLRFNLSAPITKDTPGFNITYDFTRGVAYDPTIWMMFSAGFFNGNLGIRNNGFGNLDGGPGFMFTGDNTLVWQNLSVTYDNFTNDGANITGWTTTVTTAGIGTSNNPTDSWVVTGKSIASIDNIRLQNRGGVGATYLDNVTITSIPEPSSFMLSALGLLAFRRRRSA